MTPLPTHVEESVSNYNNNWSLGYVTLCVQVFIQIISICIYFILFG
ncbi:Transcription antitermination protein NusB (fragment) [Petrocella atlantisensis]|uniref:Transcription antitermination protein NusB n=1 Tax=Petrocella atlantisensis TaxID=2173034 RepID=A0A3P7P0U8_9FIRM